MRRFVIRWRGGHRDPVIEAEAQRAYREVLDESRRERIAELERQLTAANAELTRLRARLRVAEVVRDTPSWMQRGARARATLDGPTQVVAQSELRKSWRTAGRR